MKRIVSLVVSLTFALMATASIVSAKVPHLINYQGHLTDSGGAPLDTTLSMTFRVYSDSTGSGVVWTETHPSVVVADGLFNVLLGSVNSVWEDHFADTLRWLGVTVGTDPEIHPRTQLVSVPYAYRVATVDGATGGVIDYNLRVTGTIQSGNSITINGDQDKITATSGTISFEDENLVTVGKVGIGTVSPVSKLDVNGDVNSATLYRIGGGTVLSASGTRNIFVGIDAGRNNTGMDGTFVGYQSGYSNQGNFNTFVGRNVGASNTSGYGNTFVGYLAGGWNGTGYRNTFLGQNAGYFNTTGNVNTFVGDYAGSSNTTGNRNTFLGQQAGGSNTTGNYNTYLGYQAGQSAATDSGNVFIGYMAGFYATGSNKLYIANGSSASNTLIYGDFSTRRLGIGTTSPSEELHVVGDIYCTGKLTSDGGNDPPYVLYNKETRKAIIERVAHEVPKDKLDGAVLFWNGDEMRFEVYMPERGEFRDLQGNLLATVSELRGEQ